MNWLQWLRARLFPITPAEAQKRVNAIDHALAQLRGEIAALPPDQRAARMSDVQALIAEHARIRNKLADALDDRAER